MGLTEAEQKALDYMKHMIEVKPSETIAEYDAPPIDMSRFSQLPEFPNKDNWWADLRKAMGLHYVLLRDILTKLNNEIYQRTESMKALVAIVEAFASDEEELVQNEFEASEDAKVPVTTTNELPGMPESEVKPQVEAPLPFDPFNPE